MRSSTSRTGCRHDPEGGFGSSIGCYTCNQELSEALDAPWSYRNADPAAVLIAREGERLVYLGAFESCGFCRRTTRVGEFKHAEDCELLAKLSLPVPSKIAAMLDAKEPDAHAEARWDRLARRWSAKHQRHGGT